MTDASGLALSFSYDELYRPTAVVAGTVQDLSYAPLDPVGNIEEITNNSDATRDQSFVDDNLYRLTGASGIYGTLGFTYDDIGNRLTRTENAQTDTYSYETGKSRLSAITGTNPATFAYDDSGNLIHEGRDVAGSGSLILASYTYNGIGQRIKKVVGGVTTIYHYDINGNLIAESAPNGDLNAVYVYIGTMRLATIIGANIYFHLNDHLGTPQKLINTSNNLVWAADYLPFGKVNITVQAVVNNFRAPGQYFDAEIGLHYNYHRYYDPKIGRYLTPDPIGLAGMDPNLYGYVLNDPINFTDPWGLLTYEQNRQRRKSINSGLAAKGVKVAAGLALGKEVVKNLTKAGLGVTVGEFIKNRGAVANLGMAGTTANLLATAIVKAGLVGASFYAGIEAGTNIGAYFDTLVDDESSFLGISPEMLVALGFGSGIKNTTAPCEK